ncbi:hypothetical protein [Halosegnis marinus]|uniref:DUF7979 domain-containing protein n=1 Tax=Halosegnis marinus TaxID=3034023 RepID=A0ABD5ZL05_9EURY|nr:hypothetical protein [Halosegnis sp. DT85]
MEPRTRTALAALAVFLGVAALAGAALLFPHAGQQAYGHAVVPADERPTNGDAPVYDYANLSTDARTAFDRARDEADGSALVYGSANRPPEFEYGERDVYYVATDDGRYRLVTWDAGPDALTAVRLGVKAVLGLGGLLALGAGALVLARRRA